MRPTNLKPRRGADQNRALLRLAIAALALAATAGAGEHRNQPPPSSELLRNANGANDAFTGVAQFLANSRCTGSLVDPSGAGAPAGKAWLLTAGHCISLEPYGVIRNQPLALPAQFNYFVDTRNNTVTVRTRTVGWSTMKGVDLALVELEATLGDLAARGIRPLSLASTAPDSGAPVYWTGISGTPIPAEQQYLRLGRCTLGRSVQLIESSWIWHNDLSNDCPDLYAGASGSPLFDARSGEVIGVIGTSTLLNFRQGPDYDCQVNRPCVIGFRRTEMQINTSYASPVHGLARCFDQRNELDVQRPGCTLDPGFQLTVRSGANEVRPEVAGVPAAWDAALSGSQRYYAYKHFRAGDDDCADLTGYSRPFAVADAPVIRDRIGRNDGYYFLCVIAGDEPSIDSSWQQPAHASARFKRLDSQPPVVAVDYVLDQLLNGYRLTNLTGGDGPSGLGVVQFKRGPLSTTNCLDPRDYRVQTSIPAVIRTSELPDRICWLTTDRAGNAGDPAVFDFGPPTMLPEAVRNAASLMRGRAVGAGSAVRIDTFNLTDVTEYSRTPVATLAGVRASLIDIAGRTLPVLMTGAGPLFVEAILPDAAAPGRATYILQSPRGPSIRQAVEIRRTAPGLYYDPGTGVPRGYADDNRGNLFPLSARLPVSSTPGGLDVVVYGTGFRAASEKARVRIGTYTLKPVAILPHPEFAGVDEVRFQLPQDFPLRLYQAIAVETRREASNYIWIYLD